MFLGVPFTTSILITGDNLPASPRVDDIIPSQEGLERRCIPRDAIFVGGHLRQQNMRVTPLSVEPR
ncbi:hypothetical protein JG687_00011654 [Phytophthora cactorum]|uniref:Uncharacterized protein n=1 Tax=Phytophthora cactorum TaxID=29920 RepID=A0A329SV08_9STRA|nr:hypothetical protein Pcac1_g13722 [Phytophthora cactorum]KAG2798710.1 hypothetical protein PC111_g20736 [Phytophthora cactorum]KAG2798719.1 hypothetical protein PC112_g21229 [Phytophthora cactorum]KAG2832094.1 hypothetical protein PC113_g20816 [Phytophthora cactorum]KAG2880628.1 hypothetical protein PC114_g21978 [Phytophthora cactorum]